MTMTDFYSQFISKNDVVFDVGANTGERSAVFAQLAGKVIAVEPQRACIDGLVKRFAGTNVVVIDKAVGEQRGTDVLNRTVGMTTTASMSNRFMADIQASGRFGNRWDGEERVETITLDDLVALHGKPSFIKIDVEGFEPEVIRGLTAPVDAFSIEFHPELLYMAKEVLDHATKLGPIITNYALGNNFTKLELTDWVLPNKILEELKKFIGNTTVMGDIYVRWQNAR